MKTAVQAVTLHALCIISGVVGSGTSGHCEVDFKVLAGRCRIAHDQLDAPHGPNNFVDCNGPCTVPICRKACRDTEPCTGFELYDDGALISCKLFTSDISYVEPEEDAWCYMCRDDRCPLVNPSSVTLFATKQYVDGKLDSNGNDYGFDLDENNPNLRIELRKKADFLCKSLVPAGHHCETPYFKTRALLSFDLFDELSSWDAYYIRGFDHLAPVFGGTEHPTNRLLDKWDDLFSSDVPLQSVPFASKVPALAASDYFWTGSTSEGASSTEICSKNSILKPWFSLTGNGRAVSGSAARPDVLSGSSIACDSENVKLLCTCFCRRDVLYTAAPTTNPTTTPTTSPSVTPTTTPTTSPSVTPTTTPTISPSVTPTTTPTTSPSEIPTATPTVTPTTSPEQEQSDTPDNTDSPTMAPTLSPVNDCTTKSYVGDDTVLDPVLLNLPNFFYGIACSGGANGFVSGAIPGSTASGKIYTQLVAPGSFAVQTRSLKRNGGVIGETFASSDGRAWIVAYPEYVYRGQRVGLVEIYFRSSSSETFRKTSTEYGDRRAAGEFGRAISIDMQTDDAVNPKSSTFRKHHWPTIVSSSVLTRTVYVFIVRASRHGSGGPWIYPSGTVPITGPAVGYNDGWGEALSIRGKFLFIGAPKTTFNGQNDAGRVYIQSRPGGVAYYLDGSDVSSSREKESNTFAPYSPQSNPQILPYIDNPRCADSPSSCGGDQFGASMATSEDGSCLIVGAPGYNAAYVFCKKHQEDAPYSVFFNLVKTFHKESIPVGSFGQKVGMEYVNVAGFDQWIATVFSPLTPDDPIFVSHAFSLKGFSKLVPLSTPASSFLSTPASFCHSNGIVAVSSSSGAVVYKRGFTQGMC